MFSIQLISRFCAGTRYDNHLVHYDEPGYEVQSHTIQISEPA